MIEAVILDFDGLILDTETPYWRAWEEVFAEHGLRVPANTWAEMTGSSADPPEAYELLERLLHRPIDRAAVRRRRAAREAVLLEHEGPMPGVAELIDDATRRGLRLAVASSSELAWVARHLRALGWEERFAAIASADDVQATKPAPDLYRLALARLAVGPTEAIAFEDSVHGVAAAKAAGLFCVAVPNQVTRHLLFAAADVVVDTLAGRSLAEFIEAAETRDHLP